ncbi:MAG: MarR family transcriptional regulator [Pseudomonadota bacterium]
MAHVDAENDGFELIRSPSHLLHRAQQLAANQSAEALKAAGVTLRQFSLLSAVEADEGTSQSQLVDKTGIDRSTLADMVARMERAGLIIRRESERDARAKAVWLTERGRQVLSDATPAVAAADAQLLSTLPKNKRAPFLSTLFALSEASDRQILQVAVDETGTKTKLKDQEDKKPKAKAKVKAAKDDKPKKKKAAKKKKDGKKTKAKADA